MEKSKMAALFTYNKKKKRGGDRVVVPRSLQWGYKVQGSARA
jgi:hypothetical protein